MEDQMLNELFEATQETAKQEMAKQNKVGYIFTAVILLGGLLLAVLLGLLVNAKCAFMFAGFWSAAQYINITLTSFANVFCGRDISAIKDTGWKNIFLVVASICLAVAFCI